MNVTVSDRMVSFNVVVLLVKFSVYTVASGYLDFIFSTTPNPRRCGIFEEYEVMGKYRLLKKYLSNQNVIKLFIVSCHCKL